MDTSKTGKGRRHWTSDQLQRLLARFHHSRLTQTKFASQQGVEINPFEYLKDLFTLKIHVDPPATKQEFDRGY
jgi:hypothetical protein